MRVFAARKMPARHSDAIGRQESKSLAGCHTPITSRLRPSPASRYSVARKNGSGSSKDSVDFAWQPIVQRAQQRLQIGTSRCVQRHSERMRPTLPVQFGDQFLG